jgi:hypothetical protein
MHKSSRAYYIRMEMENVHWLGQIENVVTDPNKNHINGMMK